MKQWEKWFVHIVDFLEIIMNLTILIVIGAQIITRSFFNMPLKFPEEVAVFAMIAMIFGGICMVEKDNAYLMIDVFISRLNDKGQRAIFIIGRIFILIIVGAILIGEIKLWPSISQLYTQAAKIPYSWLHIWIILFTLIWGICAIVNIVNLFRRKEEED